ncbi:MAG: cytidylate kinase-like family protein [Erysipelotrichaceae bacterium]|nr:cytidylate kinase-like family protein [Erysipelotrichaceae bacterium]MDY5252111.1 cytidylate kinase-like family protein [Erysipelotrichaceae bacterium]
MKNTIITISREFGSGGRTIGKQVAAKLNIPCYDEELINKIAQESGLDANFIKQTNEQSEQNWLFNAFANHLYHGNNIQDYVWLIQCDIITKVANEGPCVIVGRCADYVLKDKSDLLKVFIHADINQRAKRVVEVYGETDEKPLKRVKEKDKKRAAYYRYYTENDFGEVHNYDVALDSGKIGIDRCVEIIADLYQDMTKK